MKGILNYTRAIFVLCLFGFLTSVYGQKAEELGANDPIRFGDKNALVKIEVFVDFQCPSCGAYYPKLRELFAKYPGQVSAIYRHFPLPMHDKARLAAQAVEAAKQQGKAAEMIDLLFSTQKGWSVSAQTNSFIGFARKLKLDINKYRADFLSVFTAGRIDADTARARALKVMATPTVFINGRELTFVEAQEIDNLVKQELDKK